ncbi:Dihydroneopterin aldolase [uncultured Candidatus Thioglobus sp.]|nr:Dihydroneopterin aldolase [uncultured Candidatus Thioglobus sp.]
METIRFDKARQLHLDNKFLVGGHTMDIIYIDNLRAETIIGIYDWERKTKQIVSLDLQIGTDILQASAKDSIDDTINYKSVAERISAFIEASNFELLETLAEEIAKILLKEFNMPWLKLRIKKLQVLKNVSAVGVIIERQQNKSA